jgi:alanyl-tRNA synthetase
MTHRLYYRDSFLQAFDAHIADVIAGERPGVVLDATAFYPTSGGQVFDTGWLEANGVKARVTEVAEADDGRVVHYIEPAATAQLEPGARVQGTIDSERRLDHMQQHTGQHVLSAAFVRLYDLPTVSFHMGAESCTIDLAADSLSAERAAAAERLANEVVMEDRPVDIKFVSLDEARTLGLRKLPEREGEIRLIDVRDFDLTACGGTHVTRTGQIGCILVRKVEKARQGMRVEFVCGLRAVATARRDYQALTEAGELFSTHIWQVPVQVRKSLDDARAQSKREHGLLEELAAFEAECLLAEGSPAAGYRLVQHIFDSRDAAFAKLVAHRLIATGGVVAVLGTPLPQPTLILAAGKDTPVNAGAVLKEVLAAHGGRGGGSKEMAQGGLPTVEVLNLALSDVAARLRR